MALTFALLLLHLLALLLATVVTVVLNVSVVCIIVLGFAVFHVLVAAVVAAVFLPWTGLLDVIALWRSWLGELQVLGIPGKHCGEARRTLLEEDRVASAPLDAMRRRVVQTLSQARIHTSA